jgi:Uma2 family endonuclease
MSEVSTRYVYFFEGEYLDEDDMPQTFIQDELANYLVNILTWFFRFEDYIVRGNINVYRKGHYKERVAPDVMIIKNLGVSRERLRKYKSYPIDPPKFPPPTVAIEIISEATAPIDILPENKPTRYGELGIKEYFAFDPEEGKGEVKLRGWRYIDGLRTELQTDGRGWLWSEELGCWLVPDEMMLQFYDRHNNRILSKGDAEELARLEAEREIERERLARAEAEFRAEQERQAREELERTVAELRAKLAEKKLNKYTE